MNFGITGAKNNPAQCVYFKMFKNKYTCYNNHDNVTVQLVQQHFQMGLRNLLANVPDFNNLVLNSAFSEFPFKATFSISCVPYS